MPTIVGILTSISIINTTSERLKETPIFVRIYPHAFLKKSNGDIAIASACPSRYLLLNHRTKSNQIWTGGVAQSVTCLATDASLTAYPEVASSIPARSHTFMEIDHEIISTVILLPSAESFTKGCQLQAKVCAQSTG